MISFILLVGFQTRQIDRAFYLADENSSCSLLKGGFKVFVKYPFQKVNKLAGRIQYPLQHCPYIVNNLI